MMNIHGTCGLCGGAVTSPMFWGGTSPPPVRCESCGARPANAYGDVMPMVPAAQQPQDHKYQLVEVLGGANMP